MSLGLKGLGVAGVAASGLLAAAAAYAGAAPQTADTRPAMSNPWLTSDPEPAVADGRAAMALREGEDSRFIGIDDLSVTQASGLPEPAAWTLMIVGLGGVGGLMRRRRAQRVFTGA